MPFSLQPVRMVARVHFFAQALLNLFFYGLNRAQARKNYPRLFCLPSDYIGWKIIASGLYEEDLLRALFDDVLKGQLADFKNKTALDIGANIGNHTCFFARYFKRVLAFEPQESAYYALRANIALNKLIHVEAFSYGLGAHDAVLPFWHNVSGNLGASSFIRPDATQGEFEKGHERIVKKADDAVAALCAGENIGLIKIDVEGLEADVLQGLTHTLQTHKPFVLFEASGGKNAAQLFTLLRASGYTHFYALEEKAAAIPSRLMRYVKNIVIGPSIYLWPLQTPEDRYYQMMIAAPASLGPHSK